MVDWALQGNARHDEMSCSPGGQHDGTGAFAARVWSIACRLPLCVYTRAYHPLSRQKGRGESRTTRMPTSNNPQPPSLKHASGQLRLTSTYACQQQHGNRRTEDSHDCRNDPEDLDRGGRYLWCSTQSSLNQENASCRCYAITQLRSNPLYPRCEHIISVNLGVGRQPEKWQYSPCH